MVSLIRLSLAGVTATKQVICESCEREYLYDRSKGHRLTQCNSCQTNLRRFRTKKRAVEYKGGKCFRCGYNRCIEALEFHHRNASMKRFQIGGNHSRSWDAIKKELDKCDLVCANCHSEIEVNMRARG